MNIIDDRTYLEPGECVVAPMPYSEVCCHMRIAGRIMTIMLLEHGMAQVIDDDGSPFSFPITSGASQ